jgi:hypothetical protein
MAKTKETEPLRKHTLNFFDGDYERLQAIYPSVDAAVVIRRIIRQHLNDIEAQLPSRKLEPKL